MADLVGSNRIWSDLTRRMHSCAHLPRKWCGGREASAGLVQTQLSLDLRKCQLKQEPPMEENRHPLEQGGVKAREKKAQRLP